MKKIFLFIIAYLMQIILTDTLLATSYTWTGTTNTSWYKNTNWSPNGIPVSTSDTVTIVSATNQPVLDTNRAIGKFTMTSGTLDLSTWTLNITGKADFNGGTIQGTATDALQPRGTYAIFAGTTFDVQVNAVCGYLELSGSTFNKVSWLEMTGSTDSWGIGSNTFTKKVTIKNNSSASLRIAGTYANTFSDTVIFINTSSRELRASDKGHTAFNGNIYVNSTGGPVDFGISGGDTATLASGKIIAVGSTGFSSGTLLLQQFIQSGSTAQAITLTGSAVFNSINSIFNGKLTVTAPSILCKETKFYDTLSVTQTGGTNTASSGGNLFDKKATIKNHGSANFQLATDAGDTFNADAVFVTDSTGNLYPCYSDTNYVKGNLTATGSLVSFKAGTGVVRFSGSVNQSVSGTATLSFKHISLKKTSGTITLSKDIEVEGNLQFVKGILICDTTNLLKMISGSSVSGASDSSFVSGPVKKTGRTAFVYPTGKSNYYRAIEISAPSSSGDAFTAEYFNTGQSLGNSMDGTIKYIRDCGYWSLARNSGSSNVTVKLSWDSTSCGLLDSASVKVANWTGTIWKDLGSGGVTGNHTTGKVVNSSTVDSYKYFAIGYNHCFLTANAGSDQSLCESDSVTLGAYPVAAMGTGSYTYSWSPSTGLSNTAVANPKADPFSTTSYIVTVTDYVGCTKTDTIRALRNPDNFTIEGTDLVWGNVYPAGNESNGYSIQATVDSGYIVCGSTLNTSNNLDIYLVKLNSAGDTSWTKTIGGTGNDVGYSVKQCADSGFVISGYTTSRGAGGDDIYIVKTNKTGDTLWTNVYGGSSNDISYGVERSMDGGYVIAGYTASAGAGGRDMIAVKFNSSGGVVWNHTYGTAYDETAYSLSSTLDSGFAICGVSEKSTDTSVNVLRIDKSGSVVWDSLYTQTGDQYAYSIYTCEESGFVIAGKTTTSGNGEDMLLMKIFNDGTLLWTKNYGGTGDEVAYDVKETKNYSFVSAGSTSSNDNRTEAYILEVTDYGDTLNEAHYGDSNTDEFRAVSVTKENDFAFTGRTSSICNTPAMISNVGVQCKHFLQRGLWFGNCWQFSNGNFSSQNSHFLLAGTSTQFTNKMNDFIAYCQTAKIHTVVLNRLEDIIREDNTWSGGAFTNYPTCTAGQGTGSTVRTRLKSLISALHGIGVSTILAQWLDQTPEEYNMNQFCPTYNSYTDDETSMHITNSHEILDAFKTLNDPTGYNMGFEGLMLDYEYFRDQYGGAAANTWANACIGFKDNWLNIANEFLQAKEENSTLGNTGVKIVQAYLNEIVFTAPGQQMSNIFDYTQGCPQFPTTTDFHDSKQEIEEIDNKNHNGYYFDGLSIAFTIHDAMDFPPIDDNSDPTSFLTGVNLSNGNQSGLQRARHRLEILGNETANIRKTKVAVYLRSQNKDDYAGTCADPMVQLGDLLLNVCYWDPANNNPWPTDPYQSLIPFPTTGTHYLSNIEQEFARQFYTLDGIDATADANYLPNGNNYGNVNINGGFQWYQYGLGATIDPLLIATSHDALLSGSTILRPGDAVATIFNSCLGYRITSHSEQYSSLTTAKPIVKSEIKIVPNPFREQAFIYLNELTSPDKVCFKVTDVLGRNVTKSFKFYQTSDKASYMIKADLISGLFFLNEISEGLINRTCVFSIIR